MESITDLIDFLTDPTGIGFPMLIAAALGFILYLMHIFAKDWEKTQAKTEKKKDRYRDTDTPFKPF